MKDSQRPTFFKLVYIVPFKYVIIYVKNPYLFPYFLTFNFNLFIDLFLAVLSPGCSMQAFL